MGLQVPVTKKRPLIGVAARGMPFAAEAVVGIGRDPSLSNDRALAGTNTARTGNDYETSVF